MTDDKEQSDRVALWNKILEERIEIEKIDLKFWVDCLDNDIGVVDIGKYYTTYKAPSGLLFKVLNDDKILAIRGIILSFGIERNARGRKLTCLKFICGLIDKKDYGDNIEAIGRYYRITIVRIKNGEVINEVNGEFDHMGVCTHYLGSGFYYGWMIIKGQGQVSTTKAVMHNESGKFLLSSSKVDLASIGKAKKFYTTENDTRKFLALLNS